MKPLHEQYRPQSWGEVVGQDKAINRVSALRRRGLGGRAFWLSGVSGCGKTTIGRLIAAEVASDFDTEELDAGSLTPARLNTVEETMSLCGMMAPGGRAYIINEAHGLRKDTVRQLLVLLERLPSHVVVIFTTTLAGQNMLFEECDDSSPLISRCAVIPLAQRDLAKPFAKRAREIAEKEGLDGRPIEAYVRLVQRHKQNLRAVLQEVESGGMST